LLVKELLRGKDFDPKTGKIAKKVIELLDDKKLAKDLADKN
jgi:hypothetical protein